ncbi:MAG: hypothetical protein R3F19_00800 [Verrucomicrobiales bacterium]
MRTTLVIDDELFVSAKKLAAEMGCSVSSVFTEALRGYVRNQERPVNRTTFHMPTFDGGGGATSIDSLPAEFHQLDEDTELAPFQR